MLLSSALRQAPVRKQSRPAKPKGGWVAYFAQTFPPEKETDLEVLSSFAMTMLEEPEVAQSLQMREAITAFTGGVTPQELDAPKYRSLRRAVLREFGADDLRDIYEWRPWELLHIYSARDVPGLDPKTKLSEADLSDIAEAIFMRAAEAMDAESVFDQYEDDGEYILEGGEWVPNPSMPQQRARMPLPMRQQVPRQVVLQQILRGKMGLSPLTRQQGRLAVADDPTDSRIHIIDKDTAFDRVRAWHKELPDPNYRGFLVAVGFRAGGRLRGVGIASHPSGVARAGDDPKQHHVVDVSRIATDDSRGKGSVRGASSAIMRWFMRNLPKLVRPQAKQPPLLITFSLLTEVGTTYRSVIDEGLHAVSLVIPEDPSGARAGSQGGRKEVPKIRWEYGQEARPHKPHLLDLYRGYAAVMEGRPLANRHFRGLTTVEALRDLARVLGMKLTDFVYKVKGQDKPVRAKTFEEHKRILLERFGA